MRDGRSRGCAVLGHSLWCRRHRSRLGKGSTGDRLGLNSSSMNGSRIGFRGVEDLGSGASASFWLEAGVSSDSGSGAATNTNNQTPTGATTSSGLTFNRRSTISLAGQWGEVRLGRDFTPQYRNLTATEAALAATLQAAAASADNGAPDAFGRTAWGLGALRAPFTATRIAPALFHTHGGLQVDGEGRVLRADGSVITGLYAGGGATAGISGNRGGQGYMSGNGLLGALGLGYIAGRAAARDLAAHATPA